MWRNIASELNQFVWQRLVYLTHFLDGNSEDNDVRIINWLFCFLVFVLTIDWHCFFVAIALSSLQPLISIICSKHSLFPICFLVFQQLSEFDLKLVVFIELLSAEKLYISAKTEYLIWNLTWSYFIKQISLTV